MNQLSYLLKSLLLFILIAFTNSSYSQSEYPILLKSGNVNLNQNEVSSKKIFDDAKSANELNSFRIIQFSEIPTNEIKDRLKAEGITLLNYLPKNAYFAQISNSANWQTLLDSKLLAISDIKNKFKLSKDLASQRYNQWALVGKDKITLNGAFFSSISRSVIENMITNLGAEIEPIPNYKYIRFNIDISKLDLLYGLAPFYYFEQIDPPSEPENLVGVTNHRSNTLATSYSSGLNYTGDGITVMLQDNSRLDEHIDYTGRFFNSNTAVNNGDHGEHCGGTIAGAGNLDPIARGMAYGAEVLVYGAGNNNFNAVPGLYTSSNLRITSKSYSNGVNAGYTGLARNLDEQVRTMPELTHVFSAGNSNGLGTTTAGSQWFNITGGHKIGKNVIAVGNLTLTDGIAASSSRGPSEDGRIKPDICAVGSNVYSTVDPNSYDNKTGTSMSCPGVAGVIAQLYEGYKDLNGGNNPEAALIKAAILNTGKDLGNPGPDFIYGWGRINARRAFELISNNQYFSDDISQGDNLTHTINVPNGISEARIMVYWTDYEAMQNANLALVNDINMTVTSPSGAITNPWVLNNSADANLLNLPATQLVDNVNNVEQVTIDTPQPGSYTVNLDGFAIPQGPQKYYVVYELVTDDVVLTYPIGGEGLDSDKSEFIRWDAHKDAGTFTLEYSVDSGANWIPLAANINASVRHFTWNVPSVVTGEALVRVTRGTSSSQSHESFSIIQVPQNLEVANVCIDSVTLTWDPVQGATGYEVSFLGNKYMDSVGTSTTNSITLANPYTTDFWWSVKALGPNDCVGRRAIAEFHQAAGLFNCVVELDASISDTTNLNGRTILTCMETEPLKVGITVVNSGLLDLTNIPVNYQLNNGTVFTEMYTGTLTPNTSTYFVFSSQISIPFGTNTLKVWTSYNGDQNSLNNEIVSEFTYLDESPETLPFTEDFETFDLCGTNSNCEIEVCDLDNNFINDRNGFKDDIDWRTNEGPTPSGSTGPSQDFNPGTESGKYLYLEASGTPLCNLKVAQVISPCISLDENAVMSFAYHMDGLEMGELHLDILVNNVWTNDIIQPYTGNQGPGWFKRESIDLSPYTGNIVNFRFRGITGNGYRSDIAIDDISITSTLNINNTFTSNNLKIYPNPTNGQLFYELENADNATIQIIDANGQLVKVLDNLNNKGEIDLSNYAKGIYFMRLLKDDSTSIQKIVVE